MGDPSPILDAAWHELFEGRRFYLDLRILDRYTYVLPDINIRVNREDLEFYNLTSVPLSDGTGYAAELGVHHELHCFVRFFLPLKHMS